MASIDKDATRQPPRKHRIHVHSAHAHTAAPSTDEADSSTSSPPTDPDQYSGLSSEDAATRHSANTERRSNRRLPARNLSSHSMHSHGGMDSLGGSQHRIHIHLNNNGSYHENFFNPADEEVIFSNHSDSDNDDDDDTDDGEPVNWNDETETTAATDRLRDSSEPNKRSSDELLADYDRALQKENQEEDDDEEYGVEISNEQEDEEDYDDEDYFESDSDPDESSKSNNHHNRMMDPSDHEHHEDDADANRLIRDTLAKQQKQKQRSSSVLYTAEDDYTEREEPPHDSYSSYEESMTEMDATLTEQPLDQSYAQQPQEDFHQHDDHNDDQDDTTTMTEDGLEYDNVQYQQTVGKLVLTDDNLLFLAPWEETILALEWSEIAKRQVSPPTFAVPMLRVKALVDDENHMFRLPDQEMADALREDLKLFPMRRSSSPVRNSSRASSPVPSSTGSSASPHKGSTRSAGRAAAVAREPPQPLHEDDSHGTYSSSDYSDDDEDPGPNKRSSHSFYHDEFDDSSHSETLNDTRQSSEAPPDNRRRDVLGNSFVAEDYETTSSHDDDDDEQLQADIEAGRHRRASMRQDLVDEHNKMVNAREKEQEQQRRLRGWICLTFCCTAILFLAGGLVGGYFWGQSTNDNNNSNNRDVPAATNGANNDNNNNSNATDATTATPQSASVTLAPVPTPEPSEAPVGALPWITGNTETRPPAPPTTASPTRLPTTEAPTIAPTVAPTVVATGAVSVRPTFALSNEQPSNWPTLTLADNSTTASPTVSESTSTTSPTIVPTPLPSSTAPSTYPSNIASASPSSIPSSTATSNVPTVAPSNTQTTAPPSSATTNPVTGAPSSANTFTPAALLDNLRAASSDGGVAIDTPGTPQYEASDWMMNQDTLTRSGSLSEAKQLQRYGLATFYYSTGGPQVWDAQQPQNRNGDNATSWLNPDTDDCTWDYLVCGGNSEAVAFVMLPPAPALQGSLPPEIGLLTTLNHLGIYTGDAGQAATARQATKLYKAQLDSPRTGGNLRQQSAVESNNDKRGSFGSQMSGTLPSEIGKLSALQAFEVPDQALSGSLPVEIGEMASLVTMDLGNNQLTGSLPTELNKLSQLMELRLGNNLLEGKLKSALFNKDSGLQTSLSGLFLNNNMLSAKLPTTIGFLTNIETGLQLQSNQFVGALPSELGQMEKIKVFRVDANGFSGQVPSELRNWSQIEEFQVQDTLLSGSMPTEVCRAFGVIETVAYANCDVLTCTCCSFCCTNGECTEAS